mmetsp:Transcript_6904/g.12665  ORF Transcript_6904/g.12665 Transcript_6904/m.12665 type:complete len:87 (+) Transcript_6904:2211-2471(+)
MPIWKFPQQSRLCLKWIVIKHSVGGPGNFLNQESDATHAPSRNNVDSYPAVKAHPPTNGIPKKVTEATTSWHKKRSGDPEEKSIVW